MILTYFAVLLIVSLTASSLWLSAIAWVSWREDDDETSACCVAVAALFVWAVITVQGLAL